MSRALSTWKNRVRAKIDEGDSFEDIHRVFPSIKHADLNLFIELEKHPSKVNMRQWGKKMREKNLGDHNLGSGGYLGKQPIWDKQDKVYIEQKKENPYEKFKDPRARRYIRSRYNEDPKNGKLLLNKKVKDLQDRYLVRKFTN